MISQKVVSLHTAAEECHREVPLHVRIAQVKDNLAQMMLQEASELFQEEVLNLRTLEKIARDVTNAAYVHVLIVEHPHVSYGICARISFGASATDPRQDCFWVPVDTRFLVR